MDNSTLIIQHQFDYDLSPTSSSSPPTTTWPRQLVKHMADRNSTRSSDDPMPSTSDFVKKLYKMLEDPTFQSVVSWGPLGDCFVVKDMNEFTKSILPRMFKHSNFASFVRQLNKYDFHKVKNTDDNQFGEHSWTFRHPDFHADRRDALENIKRKVPAARKNQLPASTLPLSSHPYSSASRGRSSSPGSIGNLPPHLSSLHGNSYQSVPVLQAEILRLREEGEDLRGRMRSLERNYESVLVEMVAFQRGMAQQDGLMQNMISYFLGNQSGKGKTPQPVDTENLGFFPPTEPLPSSSMSRDRISNSTVWQLQTQLRQRQNQLERSQVSLETQLNQVTRDRKRHEISDMQDLPSSPVSQLQDTEQQFPESTQYGPPTMDANPFLPPHTVHRIIRSGTPTRPFTPNGSELGKASLLQMNELSRRAAYLNANGEDGNLWSGMTFTAGPSSGQRRQSVQKTEGDKPTHEDGHQNMVHAPPNMSGADDPGFATKRSISEERERVGLNVSTATDASIGVRFGIPEILEGRGGTRGRQPDSNYLSRDGVDQSGGYIPASQGQSQQTSSSLASSSGSQASTKPHPPDPWASLLTGQPILGTLSTFPQQGFNSNSSLGSAIEEEGGSTHEGLQVYTVGHLLPKGIGIGGSEDLQGWWAVDSETGNQSGSVFGDVGSSGQNQQRQPEGYPDAARFSTPSSESNEEEVVQPTPSNPHIIPGASTSLSSSSDSGGRKLRVRRSTYVPGWAVPPRVLLVDDDAVSRKLSSKFLKVFGCTIDVAVDGVGAVNKMNLEKYDLVLMDIVMPKLDGVSATNLIRKFDQGTPIISMTSNSKPNEIMTYYSSGMNDILPKPFTKEGLLDMLEKHLMHLKVIQQMSKLPRSISSPMFEQGFVSNNSTSTLHSMLPTMIESSSAISGSGATAAGDTQSRNEPTGRSSLGFLNFGGGFNGGINLLAGMGLTDDQYALILQNMVNGESMVDDGVSVVGGSNNNTEKRTREDLSEDGRSSKRSRFEIIE